jgi:hypothetical protein
MKRWTGEGSGHPIPRMVLSAYNLNNNYRVSDLFIEKGDYLMLRNLAIGYTIPNSIVAKAGVRNLRVYLSGQNLFVVTGYSGMTPELGYSSTTGTYQRGVDVAAYPVTKTITGGISVDF